MSTIIIVLLVIVLVVAIILKKKQDNQTNAAPKKGTAKTTAKATAAKKTSRTSLAKEQITPEPQQTTPISDDARQKIEQLIQKGSFQSAEVQINQLLKQDNSQHELYLYLLDLHIAQKDDIAIDQLIKHIHALKLEDIAETAELKRKEYESNKQPDAIEYHSNAKSAQQTSAAPDNSAAFDALVQTTSTQSFDDLQSESTTTTEADRPTEEKEEAKPTETKAEFQPLDFNFTFKQKETVEPNPPTDVANTKSQPTLDFSFKLDSDQNTPTDEEKPVVAEKTELDLDLANLDTQPQEVETKAAETLPSLDFTFDAPQVESAEPAEIATEAAENTTEQPAIVFEETTAPVEVAEVAAVEEVPEIAAVQEVPVVTATTSTDDPLTKSFPDLQQLDETELDLDLAAQYIELGAYDSARVLLQNDRAGLNAEQQQRAEMLLNKIAS